MSYRWTTNTKTPITVDGALGPQSYTALQYGLGLDPQTGQFDTATIKAFQAFLNVTVDGDFGPASTTALQNRLNAVGGYGLTPDGALGTLTAKALQDTLNRGLFAATASPTAPSAWVASVAIDEKTGVSYARYNMIGGSVSQWIAAACAARGITDPTAIGYWTTGYQTIASRESSGNANACNCNDLNNVTPEGFSEVHDWGDAYYADGSVVSLNGALNNYQCSRGLVQCIPQTFAKYHCPGTSSDIYNPAACIAASMGYVVDVYGVSTDGHDLAAKVEQADPARPPRGY